MSAPPVGSDSHLTPDQATGPDAEAGADVALLELPDALAAALADVEALAVQKDTREAVARLTGVDEARGYDGDEAETVADQPAPRSLGPAIRGMPVDDRATAVLKSQLDQIRKSLAAEQDARARAEKDVEQVRADLKATRQRFARAADQQTELQRRLDRAEADLPQRTARRIIKALLPALDAQHAVVTGLLDGSDLHDDARRALELLRNDWQRALLAVEVTAFDAEGQRFDPAVHEAISQAPAPDGVKPGTVLRQVGRGYLYGGRLLRSAQVVVAADDAGQ